MPHIRIAGVLFHWIFSPKVSQAVRGHSTNLAHARLALYRPTHLDRREVLPRLRGEAKRQPLRADSGRSEITILCAARTAHVNRCISRCDASVARFKRYSSRNLPRVGLLYLEIRPDQSPRMVLPGGVSDREKFSISRSLHGGPILFARGLSQGHLIAPIQAGAVPAPANARRQKHAIASDDLFSAMPLNQRRLRWPLLHILRLTKEHGSTATTPFNI